MTGEQGGSERVHTWREARHWVSEDAAAMVCHVAELSGRMNVKWAQSKRGPGPDWRYSLEAQGDNQPSVADPL